MVRKGLGLRALLIKALLAPAGFILSVIGVVLPWRARHLYLDMLVGPMCDVVLNSDAFVEFFMKVGFANEGNRKQVLS